VAAAAPRWAPIAWSLGGLAAVSWVRVAWLGTLRVDYTGTPLSWTVLGLAWLVASVPGARAYLRAVRPSPAPGPGRGEGPPLRSMLAGAVVLHAVAALALPYTSNDLFSNLAYGRMARLGLDPYASGPRALPEGDPFRALVSPNWLDARSAYGPVLTWLDALAGRADTAAGALIAFKLVILALTLAIVAIAYRVCRDHLPADRAAPAFALLAWNPLLAWELSGQAHNDAVMLLGLAAFVWAATAGRRLVAVAAVAFAFWAKFAVAPVLGLYLVHLLRTRRRDALAGAALTVGMGLALFLPFWRGPETLLGPLAAVRSDPTRTTRSLVEILQLGAGLFGRGAADAVYRVGWAAGLVLLAAVAVWAVRRATSLEGVVRGSLAWLLTYLLVASPFVLPWYLTWLLPLALVEPDPRWRRVVALYTALSAVAWCADVPPLQAAIVNSTVLWLGWRSLRPAPAGAASTPATPAMRRTPRS
jgi:hypothetical protein